jgi:hypothetical protein
VEAKNAAKDWVYILGERWNVVRRTKAEDPRLADCAGLTDPSVREMVIAVAEPGENDLGNPEQDDKRILRHEIVHAFMFESGLGCDSDWAHNEELVDWIALQMPKLIRTMMTMDAL